MSKQAKMIARWLHENLTWKKILMTWMVVLVASKMVLLMLTFEYFSLTALISLQVRLSSVSATVRNAVYRLVSRMMIHHCVTKMLIITLIFSQRRK